MKYIALKIKGFHFWVWFEVAKGTKTEKPGKFIGRDGWGDKGHGILRLEIDENEIIGEMICETLDYKN